MTAKQIFSDLGFNSLEAEVYVALLKHGPQTAYMLGRLLTRHTANVYKAADALASAGAIESEEGDIAVCRAIPMKSLSRQLQKSYLLKLDKAREQLGEIKKEETGEGIFKLQSV